MSGDAATFEQHRRHCFGVAYRMLGTVTDAEDVVQEAWLRWERGAPDDLREPKAWLTRTTTRLALDRLRTVRRRREEYTGPWLPEPLVAAEPADAAAELADSLSMAFLVLLEQLGPVERAVFLLRTVFDYDYDAIAEVVEKSPANCRQILARARERVRADRPRFEPPQASHQALFAEFQRCVASGDLTGLQALLREDIQFVSDGGGKVVAAGRPLQGALEVAKFLCGISAQAPDDLAIAFAVVNGLPGMVVRAFGRVDSVFVFEILDGVIAGIRAVRNPEKLAHLQR